MKNPLKSYGAKVAFAFITFFGVIFAVNIIFVVNALNSHTGVITQNAYEKGLKYNQAIKKSKEADKIPHELNVTNKKDGNFIVEYTISSNLIFDNVILKVSRPIDGDMDFSVNMVKSSLKQTEESEITEQKFHAEINFPQKGNWDLIANAKSSDIELRKKNRIFVE